MDDSTFDKQVIETFNKYARRVVRKRRDTALNKLDEISKRGRVAREYADFATDLLNNFSDALLQDFDR
jgi:hypothetical protein